MTVRLYHGGEAIDVELDLDGGTARIGEKAWTFESVARTTDGGTVAIDGRPVRFLARREGDRVRVALLGHTFEFHLSAASRYGAVGAATADPETRAQTPGRVLRVEVKPGDPVEPGTPLLLLEAMKMETTLSAEIAGTVKQVLVEAGDPVEPGKLLVVVEPQEQE